MSAKSWTTLCPIIPGWYWVKKKSESPYKGAEIACVELFVYGGVLVVSSGFGVHTELLDYAFAWAGPIPVPIEPVKHPSFRYQLYGSFRAPKLHHWGWDHWEFDRAKVEEIARRELAHDSSSVTMIIQERRGGRWARRSSVEIKAEKPVSTLEAVS